MNVEKYLSNFFKGTKNPSLEAMNFFMNEFEHPEKNLKFIHIAGTNGKGSCTEILTNILINSGYKVGKFLSPHLVKFNERISIQNKNISNKDMEKLIKKIESKIKKYNSNNNVKVTFFELITTMAILYFYENNCDFVVLETGLGGLYDCTNIVNPVVSIITSVGYDHMHILGNSLVEIAEQKAGIIKENSETIFIEQNDEVNKVIKEMCKSRNNRLHLIKNEDIKNYSYNRMFQKFDYKNYKDVYINLKGEKQIYNSCIALECVEILKNKGFFFSDKELRNALKTVVHRGRLEEISKNPLMVFDGAHNKPAIDNFMKSVNMYYKDYNKVFIVSILKTKDYNMILEILLQNKEATFIFTDGNDKKRYMNKEELLKTAKKYTENNNLYIYDLLDAIDIAKQKYSDYAIFFVGSFYIYGTVMDKLFK